MTDEGIAVSRFLALQKSTVIPLFSEKHSLAEIPLDTDVQKETQTDHELQPNGEPLSDTHLSGSLR